MASQAKRRACYFRQRHTRPGALVSAARPPIRARRPVRCHFLPWATADAGDQATSKERGTSKRAYSEARASGHRRPDGRARTATSWPFPGQVASKDPGGVTLLRRRRRPRVGRRPGEGQSPSDAALGPRGRRRARGPAEGRALAPRAGATPPRCAATTPATTRAFIEASAAAAGRRGTRNMGERLSERSRSYTARASAARTRGLTPRASSRGHGRLWGDAGRAASTAAGRGAAHPPPLARAMRRGLAAAPRPHRAIGAPELQPRWRRGVVASGARESLFSSASPPSDDAGRARAFWTAFPGTTAPPE